MGLFQQRKEEEENQWTLPSEPPDRDRTDILEEAPPVDPLALGLGVDVNSIVFPVAAPAPDAVAAEDREPEDEPGD